MDSTIFRAYSIRGIAGETLTTHDMVQIGQASSTLLAAESVSAVVVGQDYRKSSAELAAALVDGLTSSGVDVTDIGRCTTPLLNYATDYYRAGAGFMVTASHNPPEYNGLKIRTGHTWARDKLLQVHEFSRSGARQRGNGLVSRGTPSEQYTEAICQRVRVERPLELVVDARNGAAGPIALPLLARLGCRVTAIYCEPDDRFGDRSPDPTTPGALFELSERVTARCADAGIAYDGDGDRLAMVDNTGRPVYADRLLALLAREALDEHPGSKVVYELSCTQAVADTVDGLGGSAIPCPVGYAFVHEAMRQTGAVLGGEMAGHLFFSEPDFQFDDAALATAKMAAMLSSSEAPFSELIDSLPPYVSSPHWRFDCPEESKCHAVACARQQLADRGYERVEIDGVKAYFGDGWGLFRASNTQPAVTLRCEAKTPERLAEIEHLMVDVARYALNFAGVEMTPDPYIEKGH
jgi:phosphomannomutase/phosphoglucomutase